MFLGYIVRKLRLLISSAEISSGQEENQDSSFTPGGEIESSLKDTLSKLKEMFVQSSDLKILEFKFGPDEGLSGALVFIDGLVNGMDLTEAILRPLREWKPDKESLPQIEDMASVLTERVICSGEIKEVKTLPELAGGCLSGDTAFIIDGCPISLSINTKGWDKRGVSEPQSETVVRGPREGFTENLRTNTALIRRKIKNPQLCTEMLQVGRKTRTDICIMYINGVADPKVIEKVKYRLNQIKVDSILESGYIEEYIEDAPFSPYPTIANTEKPDVVAGKLLEGRLAILVDGTPFVLTVPMLFIESFQTAEDYYTRPLYASAMRMLRYIGYIVTIFAPAIYIALTAFHHELVPSKLLVTIANAREGTPFPVFIELFIMIFAYEILREAGIRLPRPVGQAISIVGALIMGDAAVSAGLVGAPVVIVIAITAVSSFLVNTQNESSSMLRVFMMALASFAGLFGIAMGFMIMLLHLGSLTSFGVIYFDGFAWKSNLQDSVIRMPLWSMVKRPPDIAHNDTTRRGFFVPPMRPFEEKEEENKTSEGSNSNE